MPTVRDMIRKKGSEVFSILPDATIYEALTLLAKHNTGALMVVRGNKVEGILSERDCVRKVDLEGKSSKNTKVSEIMTSKVIYVKWKRHLVSVIALVLNLPLTKL